MTHTKRGQSSTARSLPLANLTVLDLSWHLAGPYCTLILADLGARVIKVEAPGSQGGYDPIGFSRHFYKGQDVHYLALNRNKESVTLNLKTKQGRDILMSLVARSDVLFNNYRPGVMERLGLGYESVKQVNQSIIYASLSAFGQTGPYRDRPGVDLVIQAASGGMSMTGEPGRPPARAGIPVSDLCGGMWAAIAILSALRSEPLGTEIDISLLDGQLAMIPYFAAYYFLSGAVPGPQGSGGHSPTYCAYECADKRYLVIAVSTPSAWTAMCDALDRQEWSQDPRFITAVDRASHRDELTPLLGARFAQRSSLDWLNAMLEAGIPAARVNTLDEALNDEHVREREMVVEIEHVDGRLKFVSTPIKMRGFEPRFESAPVVGRDTADVLAELGIEEHDQTALRTAGII